MPEISENIIWPNLIVGTIIIVLGNLIVTFRSRLNKEIYDSQKAILGKRVADFSAGRQKPWALGIVGGLAVMMGLAMVTGAVIGIVQNWT